MPRRTTRSLSATLRHTGWRIIGEGRKLDKIDLAVNPLRGRGIGAACGFARHHGTLAEPVARGGRASGTRISRSLQ